VPFPKTLQRQIQIHIDKYGLGPNNLILTNRFGNPFRYKDAITHFRKASRIVGLKSGEGMHQLRHTFVSTCISLGLNIKQIQAFVGHASITETMDTYGHLFPDDIDDVNIRLNQFSDDFEEFNRKPDSLSFPGYSVGN
jgi:integrase